MTQLPQDPASQSSPRKSTWWWSPTILGLVFFALHGVGFVFSVLGVESNPNSMIWQSWALLDCPLGFAAHYLAYEAGGTFAIAIMVVLGGAQWFIWGFLLKLVLQTVVKTTTRQT